MEIIIIIKVWNLFMIFFQQPRDKFASFFDIIHNISDKGKGGIMVLTMAVTMIIIIIEFK